MRKTLLALCLFSGYALAAEEGVPTLSEDFFHQFNINSASWTEWGKVFNEDNSPLSGDLIRHSSIVKNILEHDYKINIPFDVQISYRYSSLFRDVRDPHYVYDEKNGCGAATVRVLGSVVSGSISATVPEVAFPNQKRVEQVRESGRKYNEEALHVLAAYCMAGSNREIEPALRDFLSRFEASLQISGQQILAARNSESKANAVRQAKSDTNTQSEAKKKSENPTPQDILKEQVDACVRTEKYQQDLNNMAAHNALQNIHPKEDNRSGKVIEGYCKDEIPKRAALKKENDERVAEIQKEQKERDRLARDERDKRDALARVEQEKLRLVREQHVADLKNKTVQPLTISDAVVFYDADNGYGIVAQPPIFKDNRNYFVRGVIENLSGNTLIFNAASPQNPMYFFATIDSDTKYMEGFNPRINGGATVVGEFVELNPYSTIAGQSRVAPAFKVIAIGK